MSEHAAVPCKVLVKGSLQFPAHVASVMPAQWPGTPRRMEQKMDHLRKVPQWGLFYSRSSQNSGMFRVLQKEACH